MTGHESQIDPDTYIAAVLKLYLELPETPSRAGPYDRRTALDLYERHIPFLTVEAAMLLASLRRLGRIIHHCRRYAPWPTSSQQWKNYSRIRFRRAISITCAERFES